MLPGGDPALRLAACLVRPARELPGGRIDHLERAGREMHSGTTGRSSDDVLRASVVNMAPPGGDVLWRSDLLHRRAGAVRPGGEVSTAGGRRAMQVPAVRPHCWPAPAQIKASRAFDCGAPGASVESGPYPQPSALLGGTAHAERRGTGGLKFKKQQGPIPAKETPNGRYTFHHA
jgi:hypothetical protein